MIGIKVIVERGKTGLFYATSPDVKGLLVAKPTLAEIELSLPKAIQELRAFRENDPGF